MQKTKLFFDTEFTGLHKNTTLISIGIISECGKTFYAELTDYDQTQVNDWIQENVITNLNLDHYREGVNYETENHTLIRSDKKSVSLILSKWLSQFKEVEMWSDVLAYDWVLFCDLFGGAFDIPSNVHYIPHDIATLMTQKEIDTDVNREKFAELNFNMEFEDYRGIYPKHNALFDAKVIRACFYKLQ